MESGLYRAGTILLVVGAAVSAFAALILLAVGLPLVLAFDGAFSWFFVLYIGLGVVALVGAVFTFVAFQAARRGEAHRAWVLGLTGALLPPVQTITLVAAILILVSPEHAAAEDA